MRYDAERYYVNYWARRRKEIEDFDSLNPRFYDLAKCKSDLLMAGILIL